jgi:hypothetical protein
MALRDLTPDELSSIAHENDSSLTDVQAEPNTVYHEPSDRVLSVPQGLDAGETQFVIDKDVDGKKRFFGQQPMDGLPPLPPIDLPAIPEPVSMKDIGDTFRGLGRGGMAFLASAPAQLRGGIMIESSELATELKQGGKSVNELQRDAMVDPIKGIMTQVGLLFDKDESMKIAGEEIIARNKSYLARNNLMRPEEGGVKGVMYDLGNGLGSALSSLGIAVLTKSPSSAALLFGSLQKSQIYQEAREAGKTPGQASTISTGAGAIEGALEKIGLDHFIPAMQGNSVVKRFINGAIIEGVQEGSQQTAEESITSATGVRDEDLQTALKSIAYSSFLGFAIGGGTASVLGGHAKKQAKDAGMPEDQAEQFGKYIEENLPAATSDMGEFLRREIAPIAADNKSADEFITLMQKFNNDADVVNREELSERERAIFDEYIDYFNKSTTDSAGVDAVEKSFFDKATAAGVDQDQAVAASKLLGARADAASRALGVSPLEWYNRHNLELEVQRDKEEAVAAYQENLDNWRAGLDVEPTGMREEDVAPEEREAAMQGIEERLDVERGAVKDTSLKKPIIAWMRKKGGVRAGSIFAGELKHIGIDPKRAPGLIRKAAPPNDYDNIPANEFFDATNIRPDEDGNGYVDRDWLIEALRDEQFGKRAGQERPVVDESFQRALDEAGLDPMTATAEEIYEKLGPDADIVAAGKAQGETLSPKAIRQIRGLMKDNPELDVNDAVSDWAERASIQGDTLFQKSDDGQTVLLGAEKISDKQLAERKFQERLQPKKAQKGMDEGLFGDEHKQTTLFQSQKEEQTDGMGGVRGSTTFSKGGTVIRLFKDANASTIFHELGHVFLRDMKRVAADTKRPMVRNDWKIVKEWLGVDGNKLTEEQEEKFARGFEAYLREGKAPKPGLQSVFDRFKTWLESIYKSAKDLKVDINDDIRRVFDRMLGGDFVKAEKEAQKEIEDRREADYELVAQDKPSSSLIEDTARNLRDVSNLASDAFVPVSTRLGNIDRRLKHAVRRFIFRTGLYSNEDRAAIKGFIDKVSKKFSEADYRVLDLALKNRDTKKVDELIKKYDAVEDWKKVRETLDDIYSEAEDVGLDMGYVEDYFPRKVKSDKALEFLSFLKGTPQWGEIQEAIQQADVFGNMTPEERAEVANNYLRGFTRNSIDLAEPDAAKSRTIDYVTPQMNEFYEDSTQTLMNYITGLRHGIESRKLFGKSEKETDKNIGAYVVQLIEEGVISPKQEAELKKILKAVVEPVGTRGFVGWSKNASYIYLMGSPISAITQIQDLAFSLAFNGYYRTGKSLLKSLPAHIPLAGRKIGDAMGLIRKEDIGIDNILEEYSSNSRASKAVRATFKAVGLTGMDDIGKEVYINAALERVQKANKKGGPAWEALVKDIFGVEGDQFKQDLKDGILSENVKYMLFSELSDIQPISLAEMPRGYLRGGNGRIFYMLKTYTVKQIDIYRRTIISEIASGDPKRMIVGVRNMIHLGAALMLMGMASDALKDLLLGRKIDVDQLVTDNILKIMGFTKFQIYKARQEGIAQTFFETLFIPPNISPLTDLQRDVRDIGIKEKKPLKDAEMLGRIPLVGKFYYWWWGGGHAKEVKKGE